MHHQTNRSTTSEERSVWRRDQATHGAARPDDATPAELVDTSDDLLKKVDEIRRLESEKRRLPMSTPEFHDMARRIERKAREVFGIARSQREVGEALRDQTSDSIDDEAAQEGDTR